MYCSKCGTQLPDEANFCWKCGQPQKQAASGPVQYEVCTIKLSGGILTLRWEAWIGRTRIAQGDAFPQFTGDPRGLTQQKNAELVSQLLSQGWEVLTTDKFGRVVSMRRPTKNNSVKAA
jgi:hypothetical protein